MRFCGRRLHVPVLYATYTLAPVGSRRSTLRVEDHQPANELIDNPLGRARTAHSLLIFSHMHTHTHRAGERIVAFSERPSAGTDKGAHRAVRAAAIELRGSRKSRETAGARGVGCQTGVQASGQAG